MVTISYQAASQLVRCDLIPDIVRMSTNCAVCSIAKVRRHGCARVNGCSYLVRRGGRVSDRNNYATVDNSLDKLPHFWELWRQSQNANFAEGGTLEFLKLIPAWRSDMFQWMRAAGSVFARNIWALQMSHRAAIREVRIYVDGLCDSCHTML